VASSRSAKPTSSGRTTAASFCSANAAAGGLAWRVLPPCSLVGAACMPARLCRAALPLLGTHDGPPLPPPLPLPRSCIMAGV
jgi:hypothetical protein